MTDKVDVNSDFNVLSENLSITFSDILVSSLTCDLLITQTKINVDPLSFLLYTLTDAIHTVH